jgi:hypothetical protein
MPLAIAFAPVAGVGYAVHKKIALALPPQYTGFTPWDEIVVAGGFRAGARCYIVL